MMILINFRVMTSYFFNGVMNLTMCQRWLGQDACILS